MMFQVSGADRDSGDAVEIIVDAKDEVDAEYLANRRNIMVSQVVLYRDRTTRATETGDVVTRSGKKQCPKCKEWIDATATKCPYCRSEQPAPLWATLIGLAIVFAIGIWIFRSGSCNVDSPEAGKTDTEAKPLREIGETLTVGYTSYCVWDAWFSDRLSQNEFLDKRPNAAWLFINVSVRNNDTKNRMIPPFELVDENGAQYESSADAMIIENAIGALESLNPSVTKKGFVVFDVPQNHEYRLKVSGGYRSADDGFIRIDPRSHP